MKELEKKFKKYDWEFEQILQTDKGYIYLIKDTETGLIHFEVFKRKVNEQFNCVSYPGVNSFGVWAWCISGGKNDVLKLNYTRYIWEKHIEGHKDLSFKEFLNMDNKTTLNLQVA